jgi:MYXO-CTERM domain-containing protein
MLLLALPARAEARDCAYYSGNGPSVYEMKNGLDESYASHVDQAALGGLRLNFRIDGQQSWNASLLALYDQYVQKAREHNLQILGLISNESTPLGQTVWNGPHDAVCWSSAYSQTFVDTAKLLMDRYGDQIKHWEIWNEPSCWSNKDYATDPQNAGCSYILPCVYAKLIGEVFMQARSIIAAKGLHLVSGGLFAHDIGGGFQPGVDYMTEVYEQGPWDWMEQNVGRRYPWDEFGYHLYIDQGGPTSASHLGQYLDAIEALKKKHGDASPIWMTEYGWSTSNLSEQQQADNHELALGVFEARPELERLFLFKVDNYDGWGLFRDDWMPKPVVAVLQKHAAGCTRGKPDAAPAVAGRDARWPDASVRPVEAGRADATAAKPASGCSCSLREGPEAPPLPIALGLALAACLARRRRRQGASLSL